MFLSPSATVAELPRCAPPSCTALHVERNPSERGGSMCRPFSAAGVNLRESGPRCSCADRPGEWFRVSRLTQGPHRSCDRCGPSALVPSSPVLHAPAGTREAGHLLRSPVLAHLPTSPSCPATSLALWEPSERVLRVPSSERGSIRHAELCRPEERSGGRSATVARGGWITAAGRHREELFLCFWTGIRPIVS